MKASRVMTRVVVCIIPSMNLTTAHRLMQKHHCRHLPVLDNGQLIGILSDRDLLLAAKGMQDGALDLPAQTVAEVMSVHPVACAASTSISNVASLMIEHKIDSIPITDAHGGLLGLITSTDLIELLRTPDQITNDKIPFVFEMSRADATPLTA